MPNFLLARQNMTSSQLKAWGVLDPALLSLVLHTPREKFVPLAYQDLAYTDIDIPISPNQNMLNPKTLARAIQALTIQPTDNILEIGTGSGYSTLLLSRLGKNLTSIEIIPELFEQAQKNLISFSPHNIEFILGNGALGAPSPPAKTFDKIFVSGSYVNTIPTALIAQLSPRGKLFAFVGTPPIQEAILITKLHDNTLIKKSLFETLVANLINAPTNNLFNF